MDFLYAHPWLLFLIGGWLGTFAGCALALVFSGSRIQHLEEKEAYLQMLLATRNKLRTKSHGAIQQQRAA
jgi:hypothetical protein